VQLIFFWDPWALKFLSTVIVAALKDDAACRIRLNNHFLCLFEDYYSYFVGSDMPASLKAFLRLLQDSHLPQCLAPSR
jgi:hypothetical protein